MGCLLNTLRMQISTYVYFCPFDVIDLSLKDVYLITLYIKTSIIPLVKYKPGYMGNVNNYIPIALVTMFSTNLKLFCWTCVNVSGYY